MSLWVTVHALFGLFCHRNGGVYRVCVLNAPKRSDLFDDELRDHLLRRDEDLTAVELEFQDDKQIILAGDQVDLCDLIIFQKSVHNLSVFSRRNVDEDKSLMPTLRFMSTQSTTLLDQD